MDNAFLPEESNENRSARMSVLTWHPKKGEALNLFTHIRHRRGRHDGAMGRKTRSHLAHHRIPG